MSELLGKPIEPIDVSEFVQERLPSERRRPALALFRNDDDRPYYAPSHRNTKGLRAPKVDVSTIRERGQQRTPAVVLRQTI